MSFNCLECNAEFESERSLHAHIKKHDMFLHDYYTKHYARRDLYTKDLLPFKNKEQYFNTYFLNRENQKSFFANKTNRDWDCSSVLMDMLEYKVKDGIAPSEVELQSYNLPTISTYKRFFNSYGEACKNVNASPKFSAHIPKDFSNKINAKIFIDTREQQPLDFVNSEAMKLDLGDYAIENQYFSYTFVDRKSEGDFKSTLSQDNLDRFKRELERARGQSSFIFIVVESDMDQIEKNNTKTSHKCNLSYIYHNMRAIQNEFKDCCQFVFSGSRENSQKLIPRILFHGRKLWNVDLQFYINERILNGVD